MERKYIDGKYIKRTVIAYDIKKRNLKKKDILELCEEFEEQYELGNIEMPFDDNSFTREDKKNWTENYLNELCSKATVEIFNKDYLLYINNVAEYLHKKGEFMRTFIFSCVCFVLGGLAVGVAGYNYVVKPKNEDISAKTSYITQLEGDIKNTESRAASIEEKDVILKEINTKVIDLQQTLQKFLDLNVVDSSTKSAAVSDPSLAAKTENKKSEKTANPSKEKK